MKKIIESYESFMEKTNESFKNYSSVHITKLKEHLRNIFDNVTEMEYNSLKSSVFINDESFVDVSLFLLKDIEDYYLNYVMNEDGVILYATLTLGEYGGVEKIPLSVGKDTYSDIVDKIAKIIEKG